MNVQSVRRIDRGSAVPQGFEARQAAQHRHDVDAETGHWRCEAAKVSGMTGFEKAALKRRYGDGFRFEIRQQLVKLLQVGGRHADGEIQVAAKLRCAV